MAFYPLQLRQARAARHWSLQDAATASGLSAGTIAKWERQDDARPVAARTQTLNKYIALYELAHQRFVDNGGTIGVLSESIPTTTFSTNNKWGNLRLACPSLNQPNARRSKRNRTGAKGVCLGKGGKYIAQARRLHL
jgi:transcriptional regulator with XRE-family HTH domain